MAFGIDDILGIAGLAGALFGGGSKAPKAPTLPTLPVGPQLMDATAGLQRDLMRPVTTGAGYSAAGNYQNLIRSLLGGERASGLRGDTRAQGQMAQGAGALAGGLQGVQANQDAEQWQRQLQYAQLLHNLLTGQTSSQLAGYDATLQQSALQNQMDTQSIGALSGLAGYLAKWLQGNKKAPVQTGGVVPSTSGVPGWNRRYRKIVRKR